MASVRDDDKDRQNTILSAKRVELEQLLCRAGFSVEQSQTQNLKDIRDFILAEDAAVALNTLSRRLCRGHTTSLPPDFPKPLTFQNDMLPTEHRTLEARKKAYGKVIDAMFNFENKQPVAISYCASVTSDFSAVGVNKFTGTLQDCSGHASLIVGRAPLSDGRCGFIIRNSYGSDINSNVGVRSQLDGSGNILIPEDALFNNLKEVSVIPPKGETYSAPRDLFSNMGMGSGFGTHPSVAPVAPSPLSRPTQAKRPAPQPEETLPTE